MLNFRKIKQDLSPASIRKGEKIYDDGDVFQAVLREFDTALIKVEAKVRSQFDHDYSCHLEIDKKASEISFSKCGCPKKYDCEHVVAAISYIESHLDELIAKFAQEAGVVEKKEAMAGAKSAPKEAQESRQSEPQGGKKELKKQETALSSSKPGKSIVKNKALEAVASELQEASKRFERQKKSQAQSEVLEEYRHSWSVLANSPLFIKRPEMKPVSAQLYLIIDQEQLTSSSEQIEALLSIRLPRRVKPIQIPDLDLFFQALAFRENIEIAGDRLLLTRDSFNELELILLDEVTKRGVRASSGEKKRLALTRRAFGSLLHTLYAKQVGQKSRSRRERTDEEEGNKPIHLQPLYLGGLDQKMMASPQPMQLEMRFEYLEVESPKVMLHLHLASQGKTWPVSHGLLLPHLVPGVFIDQLYYPFAETIKRAHLEDFSKIQDLVVPEPMFGTLFEHGISRIRQIASVDTQAILKRLTTVPSLETPKVQVDLQDLQGELQAKIIFFYEGRPVPSTIDQMQYEDLALFLDKGVSQGREIWFESEILHHLFSGFHYVEEKNAFVARGEQNILHFMTRVLPEFRSMVDFQAPQSLLKQYCYDATAIGLSLKPGKNFDEYSLQLTVKGPLEGIEVDQLRECVRHGTSYIKVPSSDAAPLSSKVSKKRLKAAGHQDKVVVLDLDELSPIVTLLGDLGVEQLSSGFLRRPLWTLAHLDHEQIAELGLDFEMSESLREIEQQLKGEIELPVSPLPKSLNATLRPYQVGGVQWLERLRAMRLSGVLADDMGLGKTLQAICALSKLIEKEPASRHLIVCPTSLVDNWKEEIERFQPRVSCAVITGSPSKRESMLKSKKGAQILITSYSLMQKDVEHYKKIDLSYLILDEAQYIKNRQTRNARCAKELQAGYRLVLTGTPIENSLEELWSLFDFLMHGFLGSFESFCERYLRPSVRGEGRPLANLRRRIAPFILRRMKEEVLDDLPPINEIVYHCHLLPKQQELYNNFAQAAKKELSALVAREGFEKVQIHVLATLTRLKQICCHPAIFHQDQAKSSSSAKYELFFDLVDNLAENGKKAVVFSQYTRMLSYMKQDLQAKGVRFCYLDGTSKNRMEIVKEFNNTPEVTLFLVSLKAGGAGLNLIGADTVIHYDMWWNPAVESQATDRVHRIGQTRKVSSYKLVTLGTIEEKIVALQEGKKGLVKQVVGSDDDVISKLTWNEVLEILST